MDDEYSNHTYMSYSMTILENYTTPDRKIDYGHIFDNKKYLNRLNINFFGQ